MYFVGVEQSKFETKNVVLQCGYLFLKYNFDLNLKYGSSK